MTFLFHGYKDGLNISGCRSFPTKENLIEYLEKKDISDYQIFDTDTRVPKSLEKLVSYKELSIFCRQMSVIFYSDITVMDGVLLLHEQTDCIQLKTALQEIYNHMRDGMNLSEAIAMYTNIFNSYFIDMVKMGEDSGNLDMVFSNMSNYFEKEHNMRIRIKSALTYPVILSVMMAAVIVLLIVKILPMFGEILNSFGQEMPALTNMLLNVGIFLSKYGVAVCVIIVVVFVGLGFYFKTDNGRFLKDKLILKNKLLSNLYSKIIVSRFSRSLGILLKSGANIITALKEVKVLVENKFLEHKLDEALVKLENGDDLAITLKSTGIFPPLFIKMLIIGNTTGKLDEMLENTASVFDDEVKDSLDKLTALIEPMLIIILSIVVGIILLSVMLPMIKIMTNIG